MGRKRNNERGKKEGRREKLVQDFLVKAAALWCSISSDSWVRDACELLSYSSKPHAFQLLCQPLFFLLTKPVRASTQPLHQSASSDSGVSWPSLFLKPSSCQHLIYHLPLLLWTSIHQLHQYCLPQTCFTSVFQREEQPEETISFLSVLCCFLQPPGFVSYSPKNSASLSTEGSHGFTSYCRPFSLYPRRNFSLSLWHFPGDTQLLG